MQLSETIKLYPTKQQKNLIFETMNEYISTVNSLVFIAVSGTPISKYTTADVNANLPSALANQCIRDAKSIVKKHYKNCRKQVLVNRAYIKKNNINKCYNKVGNVIYKDNYGHKLKITAPKLPILHTLCFYVNNQNFKLNGECIEFPVMINGKSKRISIATKMTDYQKSLFISYKLGTLRVVIKNNSIVAQVIYEVAEPTVFQNKNVMGVDLGIKCPAVSKCSDGSVKFYGNGRKNKYMRRHYKYLRKKLQSAKKPKAVERINNKEQRIMKDIDHKISHDIVKTAVAHNVSVIKLEQLENIRSTTRTSRKNNPNLHTWSFYRLAKFIEYKAKLAGITVEYVNPAYTSQKCPVCGDIHHANDRKYTCKCGYHTHRDILGAINIMNSTEFVSNRQAA